MLAFMFSLVLVAVNIGQIITILVPIINENASPDHNYNKHKLHQMECGLGAEITAVSWKHEIIYYFILDISSVILYLVNTDVDISNTVLCHCIFHYQTLRYENPRTKTKSYKETASNGNYGR